MGLKQEDSDVSFQAWDSFESSITDATKGFRERAGLGNEACKQRRMVGSAPTCRFTLLQGLMNDD